jgi:FtsZ-interacting cell division protein YlmF
VGILDKFKDFITVEDDEYDEEDEYEDDYDDYSSGDKPYKEPAAPIRSSTTPPPFSSPRYTSPSSSSASGYKSYRAAAQAAAQDDTLSSRGGGYGRENVIAMPNSRTDMVQRITQRFKIVVIDPKGFEDCPQLVDSLKSKKPVIINLEALETDKARKIFDFLSGATYALSGNVQKIAANIFIFMPANVDISSPLEERGSKMNYSHSPDKSPFA